MRTNKGVETLQFYCSEIKYYDVKDLEIAKYSVPEEVLVWTWFISPVSCFKRLPCAISNRFALLLSIEIHTLPYINTRVEKDSQR